jgi:hypothetical protein
MARVQDSDFQGAQRDGLKGICNVDLFQRQAPGFEVPTLLRARLQSAALSVNV